MKNILVVLFFLLNIPNLNWAAESFGINLGSYNGVSSYSNCSVYCVSCNGNCGIYNYIDGDYIGIKWQCVEYVRRYYYQVYGRDLASYHRGDANTFYDNASKMGLERYPNGGAVAPQVGDIVVSEGGGYGHVAIVRSVNDNQVCTIQQNFTNTTTDVNLCRTLTNSQGSYTLASFSSNGNYPVTGWLRDPTAQSSGVSVDYFRRKNDPIQTGSQDNFAAQFQITNNDSSSVTIQNMAIDILKDGVRQTACWVKNSSTTLSKNDSYASGIHYCTLDTPGSYSTEIRLQIDNDWKTYGNPLYFEVTGQSSEGRVDVYSGVTLSPSYITEDQNYDITFQLKEYQGGTKDLYGVEVWKQDASGNDIERIKKWFDSDDTDFSPYEVKSYTVSGDSDAPVGTAGWYKIAIKGRVGASGEDRFTFGVVSGSNGVNPISFEVHGGSSQQPDLVVESPSVDDNTLTPNEDFKVFATVRNAGSSSSAATTLRYYLSTNSSISSSDSEIGTDSVDALSAGASSPEDKSGREAPSSPGTYWVGACVDAVSGESNTGNNCSTGVQITVVDDPVNNPPVGYFESAGCSILTGWTKDPDTTAVIDVHFYADGPAGTGTYVGSTSANIYRSDLAYNDKNHGFSFAFSDSLNDGVEHQIYAYAIDSDGGDNPLLTNSPKTVQCGLTADQLMAVMSVIENVILADEEVEKKGWLPAILKILLFKN